MRDDVPGFAGAPRGEPDLSDIRLSLTQDAGHPIEVTRGVVSADGRTVVVFYGTESDRNRISEAFGVTHRGFAVEIIPVKK